MMTVRYVMIPSNVDQIIETSHIIAFYHRILISQIPKKESQPTLDTFCHRG